jgi:phosphatidate phosphatase PAH1
VFLWHENDSIVVSDVDGTITGNPAATVVSNFGPEAIAQPLCKT